MILTKIFYFCKQILTTEPWFDFSSSFWLFTYGKYSKIITLGHIPTLPRHNPNGFFCIPSYSKFNPLVLICFLHIGCVPYLIFPFIPNLSSIPYLTILSLRCVLSFYILRLQNIELPPLTKVCCGTFKSTLTGNNRRFKRPLMGVGIKCSNTPCVCDRIEAGSPPQFTSIKSTE